MTSRKFQCSLTADALRRFEKLQIFDSLVVEVIVYEDPGELRQMQAIVHLHGKPIAKSEPQEV